jgi:hypothetical protein
MEIGKLKTVAIILLVLVNISFASIWVYNSLRAADIRAKEKSGLVNVLNNLGVEIQEEAIPEEAKLYNYTVIRSVSAEARIAEALLGVTEAQEMGGNIYYYESSRGKATFRSSGIFEIILYDPELSEKEIVSQLSEAALKESDGTYISTFKDIRFLNAGLQYRQQMRVRPYSRYETAGLPENETEADTLSAATILLNFINEINTEGIIIRKIERMYAGYMMFTSLASLDLKPVWRIDTDSGTYFMDAAQGVLIRDLK